MFIDVNAIDEQEMAPVVVIVPMFDIDPMFDRFVVFMSKVCVPKEANELIISFEV